jgi:hypothetical protein
VGTQRYSIEIDTPRCLATCLGGIPAVSSFLVEAIVVGSR